MHRESTGNAERRHQPRYVVACRVVAISADEHGGLIQPVSIDALVGDVSSGGARLLTTRPLEASRLWLRFADLGDAAELIECHVVRAESVGADRSAINTGACGAGLRFRTALTEWQLARLVRVPVDELACRLAEAE